jgi:hypothetical protein
MCTYAGILTKEYYLALPPMTTTSFWPKTNTDCPDTESVHRTVFNKSASRHSWNMKHYLTTKEEVL